MSIQSHNLPADAQGHMSREGGTRRYFDTRRGRMIDVHVDDTAAQRYWDKLWASVAGDRCRDAIHSPNAMVMRVTRRYLQPGSKVLEGGCGLGQNVWGLERAGYEVCGVDNAEETLEMVRAIEPGLRLFHGDVRSLHFQDASFDGYWSLGVIEHFWTGYESILAEMARVLRPGGYLFLTFPAMNPARRAKAKRGVYPAWTADVEAVAIERFYQFLLPVAEVERDLHAHGFETVESRFVDGFKGTKEEYGWIDRLGRTAKTVGLGRAWAKALNLIASPYCGHVALMVMRKR